MPKHNSGGRPGASATRDDVQRLFGDLDDETVLEILALHPSIADLESAAIWATGNGEALGGKDTLSGIAAEILEILQIEEEEAPPVKGRST
jgi:hypothetical protein